MRKINDKLLSRMSKWDGDLMEVLGPGREKVVGAVEFNIDEDNSPLRIGPGLLGFEMRD